MLGNEYIWNQNGPENIQSFKAAFLARIRDVSFADAFSECRSLPSLSFYTGMKKNATEPEYYLTKNSSLRRATAILRLNLKYSLPVAEGSFCRLCNDLISTLNYFDHFLYTCEALFRFRQSNPRIPYLHVLRPIMRGESTALLQRFELAVRKPRFVGPRMRLAS